MRIGKNLDVNEVNISLEEIECHIYLCVDISNDGRMNEEVRRSIGEAKKMHLECYRNS